MYGAAVERIAGRTASAGAGGSTGSVDAVGAGSVAGVKDSAGSVDAVGSGSVEAAGGGSGSVEAAGGRAGSVERAIHQLGRRQHGVATRAQLLARGLTSSALGRRVKRGAYQLLYRGVYRIGGEDNPLTWPAAAILATGPHAMISHSSAARMHGWLPPARAPDAGGHELVHVTLTRGHRRPRPHLRIHRTRAITPDEVTRLGGLPVTSSIRTLLDVALELDVGVTETVAAAAMRAGALDPEVLAAACVRYRGRPGVEILRDLAAHPEMLQLTRSEAERKLLRAIRESGLPKPRTNVAVGPYEVDFLWEDLGLALEVDGFEFHGSRRAFEADRKRDAWLQAKGLMVVRLTWRQITDEAMRTMVRLGEILARRDAQWRAGRR